MLASTASGNTSSIAAGDGSRNNNNKKEVAQPSAQNNETMTRRPPKRRAGRRPSCTGVTILLLLAVVLGSGLYLARRYDRVPMSIHKGSLCIVEELTIKWDELSRSGRDVAMLVGHHACTFRDFVLSRVVSSSWRTGAGGILNNSKMNIPASSSERIANNPDTLEKTAPFFTGVRAAEKSAAAVEGTEEAKRSTPTSSPFFYIIEPESITVPTELHNSSANSSAMHILLENFLLSANVSVNSIDLHQSALVIQTIPSEPLDLPGENVSCRRILLKPPSNDKLMSGITSSLFRAIKNRLSPPVEDSDTPLLTASLTTPVLTAEAHQDANCSEGGTHSGVLLEEVQSILEGSRLAQAAFNSSAETYTSKISEVLTALSEVQAGCGAALASCKEKSAALSNTTQRIDAHQTRMEALSRKVEESINYHLQEIYSNVNKTMQIKLDAHVQRILNECNAEKQNLAVAAEKACEEKVNASSVLLRSVHAKELDIRTERERAHMKVSQRCDELQVILNETRKESEQGMRELNERVLHTLQHVGTATRAEDNLSGSATETLRNHVEEKCSLLCHSAARSRKNINCTSEMMALRRRFDEMDRKGKKSKRTIDRYLGGDSWASCALTWVPMEERHQPGLIRRAWAQCYHMLLRMVLALLGIGGVFFIVQQSCALSDLKIENSVLKSKLREAAAATSNRHTYETEGEPHPRPRKGPDSLLLVSSPPPSSSRVNAGTEWECRYADCAVELLAEYHFRLCETMYDVEEQRTHLFAAPVVQTPHHAGVSDTINVLRAAVRGYFRTLERYYVDLLEAVTTRELMTSQHESIMQSVEQRQSRSAEVLGGNAEIPMSGSTSLDDEEAHASPCGGECKWRREAEAAKHLVQMQADAIQELEAQLRHVVSTTAQEEAQEGEHVHTDISQHSDAGHGADEGGLAAKVKEQLRDRLLLENREKHELKKKLELLNADL